MRSEIKDEILECVDLLDMARGKLRWCRNECDQNFLQTDMDYQESEEGQADEGEIYDMCGCIESITELISSLEEMCGY